jgi:hypothetical protein
MHLCGTLIGIQGKGLVRNLRYRTSITLIKKGFGTKPLVQNLYLNYLRRVGCETSLFTKPKKDLPVYRGEEPF